MAEIYRYWICDPGQKRIAYCKTFKTARRICLAWKADGIQKVNLTTGLIVGYTKVRPGDA